MNTLQPHQKIFRYILIGFFTVALMIGLIIITLSNLRQEAIQTHRHVAILHATTLEEHFSQLLQHLDITIDRIALLSENISSTQAITPILTELLQNAPYLRSLSLLDTNGDITASSHAQNLGKKIPLENFLPIPFGSNPLLRIGVPWSGRDFDNARMSTPSSPVLAKELFFLPILKKVFFNKKPYYVIANLNMDYLANRYISLLPQDQGFVSLWRLDGILLFSTNQATPLGISHFSATHPLDSEDFFNHMMKQNHSALNVYKVARFFPFVMEIQTDEKNALGYWDQERQKVLGISILLLTLIGSLALTLIIRYVRENERQKQQLAYEKQFRLAMEATNTGLWTWNLITNEITWDTQCFLLLGYTPNAFPTSLEKIYELTHPEESAAMFFAIKEQLLAHHSFLIERRMKTAQGEWQWIQARGKVTEYTSTHEPLMLMGVYINIDAQKKAEQLHLTAVAFETQEAILITDVDEKVLKVNEAFSRITGYNESDILGKTPRILRSGHHNQAFYNDMWRALRTKGFWQGEMWNKRKNGEVYAEYITITAIHDDAGVVTHYLANFSDITTHKVAQKEIQEMAYYDPLTHLANRRLLDDTLNQTLKKSYEEKNFGALLFIDLDHFKELNDTFGHDAGDMLLIQAAARLKDCIRQSDFVARLGGDEFIVILPNLGNQRGIAFYLTQAIATKVLALLCEPYSLTHGNYVLSASIGCTLFGDDMTKDAHAILKEADQAMYNAKDKGRNSIYFFDITS